MKIIAVNKKGMHDYEVIETIEAGIALIGDEVKSIRAKQVSLQESYVTIHGGEAILLNCNITPYAHAYLKGIDPRRSRKLLLHKKEIMKLIGAISQKGLTIIPLKMYISGKGLIKIEIAISKHKKATDKKRELRERDIKREMEREVKTRR